MFGEKKIYLLRRFRPFKDGAPGAAEQQMRAVTLSSAGLAQIKCAGMVASTESAATFRVRLPDVDDTLRSLIVADPAGGWGGVRLPVQDRAAEAFCGLPVRPEDLESRASLLKALRSLMLREPDKVRLLASDLMARLASAAEALAETRTADTRQIAVALRTSATAGRKIGLTHVAGPPLWKPSWRLTVPAMAEAAGMLVDLTGANAALDEIGSTMRDALLN